MSRSARSAHGSTLHVALRSWPTTGYSNAEWVVLVCYQLNTLSSASLDAAFPPHEARRLTERLEWDYTLNRSAS